MRPNTSPLKPSDIRNLFIHQLNRINCTKGYLNRNLPALEEIASFKNMKLAIQENIDDVKNQQLRIDKMYSMLGAKASDEGCEVIKAVLEEAFKLGQNQGKLAMVTDIDIILYMQLIQNIELTSFRMLKLIARYMGDERIEQMVKECSDENMDNDELFTLICAEYLAEKANAA